VIEEANMTANIFSSEIERILDNKSVSDEMSISAKAFAKTDAATKIAHAI
jgi:UDP-N-acetylglucosamine:LPS N-acetylglucosamine transferase